MHITLLAAGRAAPSALPGAIRIHDLRHNPVECGIGRSMNEGRFPNLFILGAPKCGTTAMSHYLAGHPRIFMSESAGLKEPNFFDTDLSFPPRYGRIRQWSEYARLFERAPESAEYGGEASPLYLFSGLAVPAILAARPQAKFVIMLRNPIELACGLHNQRLKYDAEVWSFERAWKLQDRRKRGQALPKGFVDGQLFQYGEIARLGEQLKRLFDQVPRERVHLILYDDFVCDPAGCYAGLVRWLGLQDDGRAEFPRLNTSARYRWPLVERGLRWSKHLRRKLGIPGGVGLHAAVNRLNLSNRRETLRPAFRQDLGDFFRDDVALLSRLLERDFSAWLS